MKHNIRINGKVKEIDCELGSGILDENGREIFEGDKVKWSFDTNDDAYVIVRVGRGGFFLGDSTNDLCNYEDGVFEIVD